MFHNIFTYCWWFRNPANHLRLVVTLFACGFLHPTWLFGISSINSNAISSQIPLSNEVVLPSKSPSWFEAPKKAGQPYGWSQNMKQYGKWFAWSRSCEHENSSKRYSDNKPLRGFWRIIKKMWSCQGLLSRSKRHLDGFAFWPLWPLGHSLLVNWPKLLTDGRKWWICFGQVAKDAKCLE